MYGVVNDKTKKMDTQSIEDMINGEQRRFKFADFNEDGALDLHEFQVFSSDLIFSSFYAMVQAFLHPESDERMGDVVLTEIIEDMDSNRDSFVSLEEYIADIINDDDDDDIIESEKDNFSNNLDHNKDGVLNRDEVRAWLIPVQYDYARGEAEFLVTVSDDNSDGSLSKEEILNHYTYFTGSQATDYGKAITRHEEL